MDSHTFSEPELVTVASPTEDPSTPLTWCVQVWRRGVDDHPIGCLEVNQDTLPPRKNKSGKVLWKLPTDPSQVPKFGVHEQKRLWEMFKEQKKLRRKQSKAADGGGGSGSANVGSDEPNDADTATTAEVSVASVSRKVEGAATVAAAPIRPPIPSSAECIGSIPKPVSTAARLPSPPPPPPGFVASVVNLSIHEPRNDPQPNLSRTPLRLPPPGLPASAPPPPPPGMMQPSPAGQSTKQGAESHVPVPPVTAPTMPSPGPQSLLQCRYFALAPVDLLAFPSSLAATVAAAFRNLLASPVQVPSQAELNFGGDGGSRVAEWLSYYDPAAPSTLVMGTAQAVAASYPDKWRQWHSLTTSAVPAASPPPPAADHPATRWDCQGWTAQALPSASPSAAAAAATPAMVLVVLTGRTWQQRPLAFQLTLILREEPVAAAVPPGSYRICNEVLCLSLLNGA